MGLLQPDGRHRGCDGEVDLIEPPSPPPARPACGGGKGGASGLPVIMFRTLDQADVRSKRVLVRVDLNMPVENGKVADTTRIERAAPTIWEIADQGGKVILLSHFGRPKGFDPKQSLEPLIPAIAGVLDRPVAFATDCIGEKAQVAIAAMREGEILCLENTRFHAGRGEQRSGVRRAARLARRYLRQRRVLGVASCPRLGRGARAQASELCRPQHAGRARCARQGAGDAGPAAGRHHRRRQDLDQARAHRQPARQGGCSRDRRSDGQHVSRCPRPWRRQVDVRA